MREQARSSLGSKTYVFIQSPQHGRQNAERRTIILRRNTMLWHLAFLFRPSLTPPTPQFPPGIGPDQVYLEGSATPLSPPLPPSRTRRHAAACPETPPCGQDNVCWGCFCSPFHRTTIGESVVRCHSRVEPPLCWAPAWCVLVGPHRMARRQQSIFLVRLIPKIAVLVHRTVRRPSRTEQPRVLRARATGQEEERQAARSRGIYSWLRALLAFGAWVTRRNTGDLW